MATQFGEFLKLSKLAGLLNYDTQRNSRANWAMLGDSQTGLSNGASSISAVSYNSTTGVLTLTATSHGLANNSYIGFGVRGDKLWGTAKSKVTRIDADNYSIVAPTGLTVFNDVTLARWYKYGTFNGQGVPVWFQSITSGKLNFKGAFGVTGEMLAEIYKRLPDVFAVLRPGDMLAVQGVHNDITVNGNIGTATWAAGVVTMTVHTSESIPHALPYNTGDTLIITGCTPSAYNVTTPAITVTSITSSTTTFTFPLVSDPGTLTVAGIANYTALSVYNNMRKIVSSANAYGLNVIVINGAPFGPAFGQNTAVIRSILINSNHYLNKLSSDFQNVAIVDSFGLAVDATLTTLTGTSGAGTGKTGYTASDALHYSPRMTKGIANLMATPANAWYPAVNNPLMTSGFYSYDSTSNPNSLNLIRNAGFTTTSGGLNTGTLANGIAGGTPPSGLVVDTTAALGNNVMTHSVQASSWGWAGNSVKLSWTGAQNFGTNSQTRWFSQDVAARLLPDDEYIFRCYFKTSGLAALLDYVFVTISYTVDSGVSHTINAGFQWISSGFASYPQSDFDGYIETAPQKIAAGTSLGIFTWQVGVIVSGSTAGSGFIELGQLTLEKL